MCNSFCLSLVLPSVFLLTAQVFTMQTRIPMTNELVTVDLLNAQCVVNLPVTKGPGQDPPQKQKQQKLPLLLSYWKIGDCFHCHPKFGYSCLNDSVLVGSSSYAVQHCTECSNVRALCCSQQNEFETLIVHQRVKIDFTKKYVKNIWNYLLYFDICSVCLWCLRSLKKK